MLISCTKWCSFPAIAGRLILVGSASDLPAETTVADDLGENFISRLQTRDPVALATSQDEEQPLAGADLLEHCNVVEMQLP